MTIYRRSIDTRFRCVVRTAAGQPVHRGTGCRNEESAREYARLLQRDIQRRAESGDTRVKKKKAPKAQPSQLDLL